MRRIKSDQAGVPAVFWPTSLKVEWALTLVPSILMTGKAFNETQFIPPSKTDAPYDGAVHSAGRGLVRRFALFIQSLV